MHTCYSDRKATCRVIGLWPPHVSSAIALQSRIYGLGPLVRPATIDEYASQ